jgi:hypothetical protein
MEFLVMNSAFSEESGSTDKGIPSVAKLLSRFPRLRHFLGTQLPQREWCVQRY